MNLTPLALAAALAVAPLAVHAATSVYSAVGEAQVDASDPSEIVAFFDDDLTGDVNISFTGSLSGDIFQGTLLVADFSGILLESDSIVSVDVGDDTLTAIFGDLADDGLGRGLFGSTATAIFDFDPDSEIDGSYASVGVEILSDLTPIPLPASLPMLLAGLGLFAGARRLRG